jgi:TPR repeat protein
MRSILLVSLLIHALFLPALAQDNIDDGSLDTAIELLFEPNHHAGGSLNQNQIYALEYIHESAENGNVDALNIIGVIHQNGMFGYEIDLEKAEQSYRSAIAAAEPDIAYEAILNLISVLSLRQSTENEGWLEIEALSTLVYQNPDTKSLVASILGQAKLRSPTFKAPRPDIEKLLLESLIENPRDMRSVWLLARGYENGWFGDVDADEACNYYQTAAKAAIENAFWPLGMCHLSGLGVPKDEKKAFLWISKSADAGFQNGLVSLGVMLATGQGTEVDHLSAGEAYRKAALMDGDIKAHAMRALGCMILNGELADMEAPLFGYALLVVASEGGDTVASTLLKEVQEMRQVDETALEAELIRIREEFQVRW